MEYSPLALEDLDFPGSTGSVGQGSGTQVVFLVLSGYQNERV